MLSDIIFALGCIALAEGLLLSLIPGRLMDLLEQLKTLPLSTIRLVGLTAATIGTLLITLARG